MSSAVAWTMFVVGLIAFALAWLVLSWATVRIHEANGLLDQSQAKLDHALSKHTEARAMLHLSEDILKWAERYEFGAAMRTADARRREETKQ